MSCAYLSIQVYMYVPFLSNFSHDIKPFESSNCNPKYHVSLNPIVRQTRSKSSLPVALNYKTKDSWLSSTDVINSRIYLQIELKFRIQSAHFDREAFPRLFLSERRHFMAHSNILHNVKLTCHGTLWNSRYVNQNKWYSDITLVRTVVTCFAEQCTIDKDNFVVHKLHSNLPDIYCYLGFILNMIHWMRMFENTSVSWLV